MNPASDTLRADGAAAVPVPPSGPLPREASPADGSPRANLRRLARLRLVALFMLCTAAWLGARWMGAALALPLLAWTGLAVTTLSVVTLWRCRQPWPVRERELALQLALDILALSAVFHASNGAANPFVSLYLVPLVMAAATLPRTHVWLLSLLACLAYTWLLREYAPLMTHHHPGAAGEFDLHVVGMWGNFLLSAGIIGVTVVNMGAALRERESRLARAREGRLRSEQIMGLATLAAGAAHELGTPLSTIAVLSRELEHECAGREDLQSDLRLLRAQVGLCKDIIQRMLARNPAAGDAAAVTLAAYLDGVVESWRLMRPAVPIDYQAALADGALAVREDATLAQALVNVLNNAGDASPDGIQVRVASTADRVVLQVFDRGAGVDSAVARQLGRAWFTTRAEGHGLGLFLSNATLERLGGTVRIENRSEGGACTTVEWPLCMVGVQEDR
ncbi:MAG: HAMP domain-containing histidine kinase [Pseudomonadota bacterium]|nr:HAMP domain-containing histidine kinase [Pseudomonadota bacterium]